jgi:hypothetical protein
LEAKIHDNVDRSQAVELIRIFILPESILSTDKQRELCPKMTITKCIAHISTVRRKYSITRALRTTVLFEAVAEEKVFLGQKVGRNMTGLQRIYLLPTLHLLKYAKKYNSKTIYF